MNNTSSFLSSKKRIALEYKKLFDLEDRDGDFYEWLCEDFCERDPSECDGECLFW